MNHFDLLQCLASKDIMYVILAAVFIGGLVFFWVMHKKADSSIDIADLVCSSGHLNERKVTRLGAWLVSTWGFVYLVVSGNLTEFYFTGYMGAWVANALLGKLIKGPDSSKD